MKRKMYALLLSALVLPGLGQLYLGRKVSGVILIALINLILLMALFVVLRGLSPVIAAQISGGTLQITSTEIIKALDGASTFGKGVLASFVAVWLFAVVDILKQRTGDK
jgi:TM2 domain-containing membrane protein YozV